MGSKGGCLDFIDLRQFSFAFNSKIKKYIFDNPIFFEYSFCFPPNLKSFNDITMARYEIELGISES
ncbi:hypothetical protein XaraCFBP7407_18605 [Xanthomonas arboricola pv. arracaciae]|nr:hypothetical protein XaraCFBP7407_18605 [Xanthomonas arboricola pv. arracaciae]